MKKSITFLMLLVLLGFSNTTNAQMDPMIGQISMFAGNFAPRGWAFCDGQLLPISQNQALFSLLGTTYGGDGRTTFALPDLRGRAPIHKGYGPGLTTRTLGQKLGSETTTFKTVQIPTKGTSRSNDKAISVLAGVKTTGTAGDQQTQNNMQPSLAINYIIALQGVYPSRN